MIITNIFKNPIIKSYANKYRRQLILGAFFVLITNFFLIAIPRTFKMGIDAVENNQPDKLTFIIICILIFALIAGVSRFFMRNILFSTGRIIEEEIRNDFFGQLLRLPSKFYDVNKTGDILSRSTHDLDSIRFLFGHVTMHIMNVISLYTFAIVSLMTLNIPLTILAITPFPMLFWLSKKFSKQFFILYKVMMEKNSELTVVAQETFSSITTIKAFAREKEIKTRFFSVNEEYVNSNLKLVKIRGIFSPFINFFTTLSTFIILIFGGYLVIKNKMTLGAFVAFHSTLAFLIRPTIFIGWITNMLQRSKASLVRLDEIMSYPDIIKDSSKVDKSISELSGNIEISKLNFSYFDTPVLNDISCKIKAGEMVAVIGEVGSGKSTLIQLLQRLYDSYDGAIKYNGYDLKTVPISVLYKNSGYVSQEPIVFSGTIKENIAYDNQDIDVSEIIRVTEIACLTKDIDSFKDGYNTIIGENGITLSGGQKQRLSIARALIKNPNILFFDNAFSAIDTETEEIILQNILELKGKLTLILIAHRFSTLKYCDKILLMDNGSIIDQGTHQELLEKNKTYEAIYEKQSL